MRSLDLKKSSSKLLIGFDRRVLKFNRGFDKSLHLHTKKALVHQQSNQTVGCNQTPVIRQLKQPIILSTLS